MTLITILAIVASCAVGVGFATLYSLAPRPELSVGQKRQAGRISALIASIVAFFVGALAGAALSGIAAFSIPVGVLAAGVPRGIRARRGKARRRRIRQAWPDAIRMINSNIMSGQPIHLAMLRLEKDGPSVLSDVWARYRRLSATSEPSAALEVIRTEEADPFTDRLIEVLLFALDAGPTLATEILGDLAVAVNEDLQLEQQTESANLEQRINSRVVAVVPTMALFILGLSSDGFREFYNSATGGLVVIVGSVLTGVGVVVVDRLATSPTEPRIFVGGSSA